MNKTYSHIKSTEELNFFLHLGYFPNYKEAVTLDFQGINSNAYDDHTDVELEHLAAAIFKETIDKEFKRAKKKSYQKHIVPISGGLDSRAILAALCECMTASDIHTYTFGTPGTYDYDIGCMVAAKLGTKHNAIALDQVQWTFEDFKQAAKRFDHQTFLFHHAPIKELKPFESGLTWSGYIGDAVTGGHLKHPPAQTLEEAKQRYLQNRCESRSVTLTNQPLETLTHMIGGQGISSFDMTYDEAVLFSEVGSITAPHVLMHGFNYATPFINSSIFDFYMSLPTHLRKNQRLFKNSMRKHYPELFSMPCKNAYGLKLSSSKTRQLIKRTRNKILNIRKQKFKSKTFKALPMTNFFDIDLQLRQDENLRKIVHDKVMKLHDQKTVSWVNIPQVWDEHINGKTHHGDTIKVLFSLQENLEGLISHD